MRPARQDQPPMHDVAPSAATPFVELKRQDPEAWGNPGVPSMPVWNVGELPNAPVFHWRKIWGYLGPGLLMGGAAIGGGEWLLGPIVTAKYGGGLMWLSTLSILFQVVYNLEISRYALATGEPIFTGKFRTFPGPMFWVFIYLALDFGTFFPYLAASAATPVAAVILGQIPDAARFPGHALLMKGLGIGIFLLCLVPLIFGGKVYDSLKAIMTFKIFVVMGFLLLLSIGYSHGSTWREVFSGFVKFGNVPIERGEDLNGNGVLDPGEDWDGDGHLDVVEPRYKPTIASKPGGKLDQYADVDGDGKPDKFQDIDHDGYRDGDNLTNVFVDLWHGRGLPHLDLTMVAFLSALIAISGQGGLTNTPISNYTRDQGWGMGAHVGAIPSLVGGLDLQLSHVGTVFKADAQALPRWKRWYRHVLRDQLMLWMPACFFGIGLPSMLSVEFLRRGTETDEWVAAGMTADAVRDRVGGTLGNAFWFITLFCGFLVLAPTMATTIDGYVRRWVDVFWTSSKTLRGLDPRMIKQVYFVVLISYAVVAVLMLALVPKPNLLLKIATNFYNVAFGFSCWHVAVINSYILPRALRPSWPVRIALIVAGLMYWTISVVSGVKIAQEVGWL